MVDPRGRDRGARTIVPINEDDPLPRELIRDLHRHLRVAAGVVGDHESELLAVDVAALIDVTHRQLGAAPQLLTERRVLRGHRGDAQRAGNGDPDFSPRNTGSDRGHDG